jgi:hypothetical protein
MNKDYGMDNQALEQAIALYKAGNKNAWLWMAACVDKK